MTRIPFNKRYATMIQGLQTVTGIRRMGIFTPLKFADTLPERPPEYAPWAEAFRAAEPVMAGVLDAIAARREAITEARAARLGGTWSGYFSALDSAAAFALFGDAPPARIVEVGSGASTHVMAAAAPGARITCIDPVPRHDIAGLGVEWVKGVLDPAHAPLFGALGEGDVAFFDSSHVLHQGTDLDIVFNRLLPVLRPGVRVHFHDIYLPDPYPPEWRLRAYNEQQGLSGWVLGGRAEAVFSSYYAGTRMAERVAGALGPLAGGTLTGGSLWLRMR